MSDHSETRTIEIAEHELEELAWLLTEAVRRERGRPDVAAHWRTLRAELRTRWYEAEETRPS